MPPHNGRQNAYLLWMEDLWNKDRTRLSHRKDKEFMKRKMHFLFKLLFFLLLIFSHISRCYTNTVLNCLVLKCPLTLYTVGAPTLPTHEFRTTQALTLWLRKEAIPRAMSPPESISWLNWYLSATIVIESTDRATTVPHSMSLYRESHLGWPLKKERETVT